MKPASYLKAYLKLITINQKIYNNLRMLLILAS